METENKYATDKMHDDVDQLLICDDEREFLFQLFASNPTFYFDIINNYTVMKNGVEICLPDLFNINVRRIKGKLEIKFKFHDNDRITTIGFEPDDSLDIYTDERIYQAFADRVDLMIKNASDSRSHLQNDRLKATKLGKISINKTLYEEQVKNNGMLFDYNNTTKLHRFLCLHRKDLLDDDDIPTYDLIDEAPPKFANEEHDDLVFDVSSKKTNFDEVKNEDNNVYNDVIAQPAKNINVSARPCFENKLLYKLSKMPGFTDLYNKLSSINKTSEYYTLLSLAEKGDDYEKYIIFNYIDEKLN
jgi:hypothetical protein